MSGARFSAMQLSVCLAAHSSHRPWPQAHWWWATFDTFDVRHIQWSCIVTMAFLMTSIAAGHQTERPEPTCNFFCLSNNPLAIGMHFRLYTYTESAIMSQNPARTFFMPADKDWLLLQGWDQVHENKFYVDLRCLKNSRVEKQGWDQLSMCEKSPRFPWSRSALSILTFVARDFKAFKGLTKSHPISGRRVKEAYKP